MTCSHKFRFWMFLKTSRPFRHPTHAAATKGWKLARFALDCLKRSPMGRCAAQSKRKHLSLKEPAKICQIAMTKPIPMKSVSQKNTAREQRRSEPFLGHIHVDQNRRDMSTWRHEPASPPMQHQDLQSTPDTRRILLHQLLQKCLRKVRSEP